jgi:uroporphyrinogen-III decarboxylase
MTNAELLAEKKARLDKVIALEKPDRTPVIIMADAFCAVHMGVKLSDFCSSLKRQNEVMVSSVKAFGPDVDGMNAPYSAGNLFPMIFGTKVKLPGVELPDNSLWQLDEKEVLTVDDYDTIIDKGWGAFQRQYLIERIGFPFDSIIEQLGDSQQFINNFEEAGYLVYSPVVTATVNEQFGGGRSLPKYMRDLFKIPDKVEAALDVIQAESVAQLRAQIRAFKPQAVFLSPARGASEFFSPKLWERFVWKYLKATADVIIEEGAAADIHIDGQWERDLDYFKAFPKGKCIFESDGVTDIYKIKEALGDCMAIKGDVSAVMTALGTPDEVYAYCTKIIRDIGPGLILSSGCSLPPDAKVENVKAMIAAATGR